MGTDNHGVFVFDESIFMECLYLMHTHVHGVLVFEGTLNLEGTCI